MKHPKAIGSKWEGSEYVHGPRQRQPSDFDKLYIVPVDWAKHRLHKLPNKPSHATKVKVGTLKKSGKFVVQSYLTPIRQSKPMRSKKGRTFVRRKHWRRK